MACPIDYEPLLFRNWPGTYDVCIDESTGAISKLNSGDACKGRIVESLPPVNMTSLSGKVACAKRGGPTFLETVRVDPASNECPRGYEPCSPYTSANDTVCVEPYKKEHECPIIDLMVVQDTSIPRMKASGFEVTDEGYP